MSKGNRNRRRRRQEKELVAGLDLANGQDFTAYGVPPVTVAEVYCAKWAEDTLKEAGIERGSVEWGREVEKVKTLLVDHRQEVRHMFRDGPEILKDWLYIQMVKGAGGEK